MKALFTDLRAAIVSTLVLAVVCCGLYPVIVWGIAQTTFKDKANGSLLTDAKGKAIGSSLLGQSFSGANYFHPRPQRCRHWLRCGEFQRYNLGPTSQKLADAIKANIAAYRAENGLKETDAVPADAVTSSGSGLDPHISVKNAELQLPRVAKARQLSTDKVNELIRANIEGPDFGILGEAGVNVLKLNRALAALK